MQEAIELAVAYRRLLGRGHASLFARPDPAPHAIGRLARGDATDPSGAESCRGAHSPESDPDFLDDVLDVFGAQAVLVADRPARRSR